MIHPHQPALQQVTQKVVPATQFSGDDVSVKDMLKAKKERDKAAKKAYQETDAAKKDKLGKKVRNRFLAKSYGKFNIPIAGTAVGLSFINPLFLLIIPGANAARAGIEGFGNWLGYGNTNWDTFSRARRTGEKAVLEYDELKRLASEEKQNKKVKKGSTEEEKSSNIDLGEGSY